MSRSSQQKGKTALLTSGSSTMFENRQESITSVRMTWSSGTPRETAVHPVRLGNLAAVKNSNARRTRNACIMEAHEIAHWTDSRIGPTQIRDHEHLNAEKEYSIHRVTVPIPEARNIRDVRPQRTRSGQSSRSWQSGKVSKVKNKKKSKGTEKGKDSAVCDVLVDCATSRTRSWQFQKW